MGNDRVEGAGLVAKTPYGDALRQTRTLFSGGTVAGLSDRELLERFESRGGEAAESAFAAIVARHGPLVLRTCRAVIGDEHEAHDAFQATFLILARRAALLRFGESLAPWLLGVARRVSLNARAASAIREQHERRAGERMPRSVESGTPDDLAAVLLEEVDRLPDGFRQAVVVCDLEGLTQEQAARQLGWPLGTVRSRLARGRDRLRGRLTRRGLAPTSATATATALLVLPMPADSTIEATARLVAGGPVPPTVRQLTEGGIRAMKMIRWKVAIVLTLSLGLASAGFGVLSRRSFGDPPQGKAEQQPVRKAGGDDGEIKVPIVRISPGGSKVWAYSRETRAWTTYVAPPGVRVEPHLQLQRTITGIYVPDLKGKEIGEIAVYHADAGKWFLQSLKEPAHESVNYSGGSFGTYAIFRVGRYLYGFSVATKAWAIHDLGEDVDKDRDVLIELRPQSFKQEIHAPGSFYYEFPANPRAGLIRVGRFVCGFSVATGTWDVLDLGKGTRDSFPINISFANGPVTITRDERLFVFDAATGRFQDVESAEKPAGADRR
jgi:RNA polymerase sigma factor (sigma-70 family)